MQKSDKRIFSIMKPRKPEENEISITCAVINDSTIFREGLVSVLAQVPQLKNTQGFTQDKYLNLEDSSYMDLIICEIEYNGKLDIEFIKTVRKLNPDSTIIVYTQIKNNEFRSYAIHCGADFFIFVEERFNLLEHLVSGLSRKLLKQKNKNISIKAGNE